MRKISVVIFSALSLISCSKNDDPQTFQAVGQAYNVALRNDAIQNWANRIADSENCFQYKKRIKRAGEKHKSAASGAFVNDMRTILNEAKNNGCEYNPK